LTPEEIISEINKGFIKPIYFLYGDEPYFIDQISDYIEKNVLTEDEKGFNQMVLYGRDVDMSEVISNAKRFPMMAERQVIIVKEAQDLSRSIDQLEPYINNLVPSTVLVFNYKYKSPDKRKVVFKKLASVGVMFESKPLYDNQVPAWIATFIKPKGYQIEPKAALMLVEFLGTDLSRIANELGKLFIVLPKGHAITPKDIEDNIGISKDFNNFELRKAIGTKNVVKANQIIQYFSQNPKNNPTVVTISLLHAFFTQLLQFHSLTHKTDKAAVASLLKVNPFFAGDYMEAGKNYPMRKVSEVIGYLREADMKSKGVGARDMEQDDLLKELVFKILH
jgi:DNA polymerase III subunit delta